MIWRQDENSRQRRSKKSNVNLIVARKRSVGDWYAVAKDYGISDVDLFSYNRYLHGGLVDYTGLAQLDGSPGKPELVLNSKIHYEHSNTGSTAWWWERSPVYNTYGGGDASFCYVSSDGDTGWDGAHYPFGLAPIFRV